VVLVHWLVHPDGIGDVQADWHSEFGGLLPDGVDAGIVRMHAGGAGFTGAQSLTFIMNFTDAARAFLAAAFEFFDGGGTESGLVVAGEVEAAPDFEALGIL